MLRSGYGLVFPLAMPMHSLHLAPRTQPHDDRYVPRMILQYGGYTRVATRVID